MSILRRRWLFFLPALLLALVITGGVFLSVKPTYSAETILLLVPPPTSALTAKGAVASPYNGYGNLNIVAAIVAEAESSQVANARLLASGVPKTGYTVTPDPTGNTPELLVTATSVVPKTAMSWDKIVAQDVRSYVQGFQQQSGTTPSTFVQANYLSRPTEALKSDKSRLRVGVAVGVVTVLLAVSVTLIFDSMQSERSSRRRRTTALPPAANGATDGEFYTGSGSIASMHGSDSRGRTSALRRP